MPHVSSHKLEPAIKDKLFKQLGLVFKTATEQKNLHKSLGEILTKTEQIMIAKRLTSIYLLQQGYSKYRIAQILKMSGSTIARIDVARQAGTYANIIKSFTKKSMASSIITALDTFTRIFPSKASKEFRIRAYGGTVKH